MKRDGVLNEALAGALARLGHTDLVVVGDCGLPRPHGVPVVDLALTFGVPTFAQVIDALHQEIVVEGIVVARETSTHNPAVDDLLRARFGEPVLVSHDELKERSATARLFVRTGEATPYANVLLRCGVPF
ncbi:D-ribose pyranase [Actinotalea sp. K2]|uniref:D-ribose pyranase n=1 Tax=Actinotalea sp. K2 TaxID=2939438 RepID=UPI002016C0CA|nr:D-ribose pyranase [Actinotalea sp. K2]MCL3861599.1 D-ribose pyranase [Actinotalea sp. K2]